ncbi:MAG: helix-turn-helix transcriptional regulator [Acidimicrobiia bacterium]
MLELAILGLLKEQELHGYELKKRLTETLGALSSVSFGSLYPALNRLEKAGAVEAAEAGGTEAELVPMTGSLGGELAAFRARRSPSRKSGRTKKVYRITPAGEALFSELLAAESASADDDRQFSLRLAFARHLPAEARIGLLERRRAHLVERLAQAKANLRSRRERLDAYTQSLIDHGAETTERDIRWLDQLISAERGAVQGANE